MILLRIRQRRAGAKDPFAARILFFNGLLAIVLAVSIAPLAARAGLTDPDLVVGQPTLSLPAVGAPFDDPAFGTTLRRVSGSSGAGGFETQIYSQLQAFSADNAYLLLTGSNGYTIRRTTDLTAVGGLGTSGWNVPRWHPTQPHTLIHFDTNADTAIRLQLTDLDAAQTNTVFTFPPQYERVRVNQSFDEISEDGRWLAGMVSRNDGAQILFAFDLQNLQLGAILPLPDLYAGPCAPDPTWGEVEPDWIGVSPLGRYMVVQWARDGTTRCSGLETFDLQTGAFVGRVCDGHQHGDLGVQPDGVTEFFMGLELYHPSGNLSIGVRELPGTATVSPPSYVQVLDWGNAEHISCRGPHGVCLVTAGRDPGNGWGPFEGELFLQYTDGRVDRLVHHRSSSCGYWVQPRATLSRDGHLAVFASDWGRQLNCAALGRGDPYVLDLRPSPPPASTPTATRTPTPTSTQEPTAAPADPPTPLSPSGTITDTTPTLQWTAVTGAVKYFVAVYDRSVGSYAVLSIVPNNTYTPAAALDPTHAYKWKVRVRTAAGWSPYSRWLYFSYAGTSPPPAPTPLSPVGPITDSTPTFRWTSITGAVRYFVAVYDKSVGSYAVLSIVPNNTYTPAAALDLAHAYKWKVRVRTAAGWSRYSRWRHFEY